jgi:RNA polymerase sigma-70 factor (ECF subfamily)
LCGPLAEVDVNNLSDDDLMRLFLGGETAAFDAIFDRYHAQVYRYALAMLEHGGGAEDVLQETFLAVVQSVGSYHGSGKFRLWLLGIARNRCLRHLQAARLKEKVMPGMDLAQVGPPSPQPGPVQEAQAGEARKSIESAIRLLPPRQRETLALFAMRQMTYQEIADLTGSPLNTVKTLIRRARIGLARWLAGLNEESDP